MLVRRPPDSVWRKKKLEHDVWLFTDPFPSHVSRRRLVYLRLTMCLCSYSTFLRHPPRHPTSHPGRPSGAVHSYLSRDLGSKGLYFFPLLGAHPPLNASTPMTGIRLSYCQPLIPHGIPLGRSSVLRFRPLALAPISTSLPGVDFLSPIGFDIFCTVSSSPR